MERTFVNIVANDNLYIVGFGRERQSSLARWGRGCRNVVLIHYILSGEGYFNHARVHTGEGFFIRANESHEYYSSDDMPWSYFWVALNGKLAEEICRKHVDMDANGIFPYFDA